MSCCPHPVERHAYNGCADCRCNLAWNQHPDRHVDKNVVVHRWTEGSHEYKVDLHVVFDTATLRMFSRRLDGGEWLPENINMTLPRARLKEML